MTFNDGVRASQDQLRSTAEDYEQMANTLGEGVAGRMRQSPVDKIQAKTYRAHAQLLRGQILHLEALIRR